MLLEEPESYPIYPSEFTTLPPLLIARLLLLPSAPTRILPELLQTEFVPVTSTLLLEEVVVEPI